MVDTSLTGRAKELEVASALTRNGIYVFLPIVDKGADLVAANCTGTLFVPVQVRFRANGPGLDLKRSDVVRFSAARTVIAFLVGEGQAAKSWYVPILAFRSRAADNDRRDDLLFITINKHRQWLQKFEGDTGIRRTFRRLIT